jgi:hypothetical protein
VAKAILEKFPQIQLPANNFMESADPSIDPTLFLVAIIAGHSADGPRERRLAIVLACGSKSRNDERLGSLQLSRLPFGIGAELLRQGGASFLLRRFSFVGVRSADDPAPDARGCENVWKIAQQTRAAGALAPLNSKPDFSALKIRSPDEIRTRRQSG